MNKNYGMELVRVTEMASITASSYFGKANPELLLSKTRETVLKILNKLPFRGRVLNYSEKGSDAFPEQIGSGEEPFDLIILESEGYENLAIGRGNSTSFIAIASSDSFALLPPDLQMLKMVTSSQAAGSLDIQESMEVNIRRVARRLEKYIENTTIGVKYCKENEGLISEIRDTGARIKLIYEGDVSACVAVLMGGGADLFVGISGVSETLLTAGFVRCLGGEIQSRIHLGGTQNKKMLEEKGIADPERVYDLEDLAAKDEIAIAATGISDGYFLDGVRFLKDGTQTHSFVVRGETRTYRFLKTRHFFDYKPLL